MSLPRMRPSFRLSAECRAEQVLDALRDRLPGNAQGVEGSVSQRHAVLCMPATERRFWSPCLDLSFESEESEESGEGGDGERGRTASRSGRPIHRARRSGPAFVFTIGTLAIVSCLSSFFGIAQLLLGHTPSAFVVPVVAPRRRSGVVLLGDLRPEPQPEGHVPDAGLLGGLHRVRSGQSGIDGRYRSLGPGRSERRRSRGCPRADSARLRPRVRTRATPRGCLPA